jgi:hypothetical protein
MDGVILYVDDNIDEITVANNEIDRGFVNTIFQELKQQHPVLGVRSLEMAEKAIQSIGSFSAIILDWRFRDLGLLLNEGDDPEDFALINRPDEGAETLEFLRRNDFFSLVYIYSTENVREMHGAELGKKYKDRIKYRVKRNGGIEQARAIAQDIEAWKEKHKRLEIPALWTKTINQAVQQILLDLSLADPDWILEVATSAGMDGGNESLSVVEILNVLLSESLLKDGSFLKSIKDQIEAAKAERDVDAELQAENLVKASELSKEKSVSKLFRRLYYTKIDDNSPIMTGDIIDLSSTKFGIIITPECDINDILKDPSKRFHLLTFTKSAFENILDKKEYKRSQNESKRSTGKGQKLLDSFKQLYNNGAQRYHFLPSFPFNSTVLHRTAVIDFDSSLELLSAKEIKIKVRRFKLNSPYLQQLRQRYISQFGRVGVAVIPDGMRSFNLTSGR